MTSNAKPIIQVRDKNFSASVFPRNVDIKGDGNYTTFYSVCLQRGYVDKQTGEWHNQQLNFEWDDALIIQNLMTMIYNRVRVIKEKATQNNGGGNG